jgi:hypothetical protein
MCCSQAAVVRADLADCGTTDGGWRTATRGELAGINYLDLCTRERARTRERGAKERGVREGWGYTFIHA